MNHKVTPPVGVGATQALSLRVSVASLVRLLFKSPGDGEWTLALERKATLHEVEHAEVVAIRAQPFGGAVRILDIRAFHELIGDFHFDNEGSRAENDLRIFIRPSSWPEVSSVCIEHLSRERDPLLESDPERELTEELHDALKIMLNTAQYTRKPIGTIVEGQPRPSENPRAWGYPTVRIYRIYQATITDIDLAQKLIQNSAGISDRMLYERADQDVRAGGRGRANAVLTLPLKKVLAYYAALSPPERDHPTVFEGYSLEETVPAVLDGIRVPKYRQV